VIRKAVLLGLSATAPALLIALASSTGARVSQVAVEVLYTPVAFNRTSQIAVEVLVGPVPADTDFTPYAVLV
jgi:hypothetical protein